MSSGYDITVNAVAWTVRVQDDGGDAGCGTARRSRPARRSGRIGRPDDMAGVAVYLGGRAGAYVTGAVIPVDGGIWAAR